MTSFEPNPQPSTLNRHFEHSRADIGVAAAVIALAWLIFYRLWPLGEDQSVFHYMAWGLRHGLTPYVDLVEVNWPGMVLVHLLARGLSGLEPWGLRLLDGGFLLLLAVFNSFLLGYWRVSWPLRAVVFTAYLFSYLYGGYHVTAQRESFAFPPAALGMLPWLAWVYLPAANRRSWFVLSGALTAAGLLCKPVIVLFPLFVLAWTLLHVRDRREYFVRFGLFLIGGLAVSLAALAWLAAQGALGGFLEWGIGYLFGTYSQWRLPWYQNLLFIARNLTTRGGFGSALLLLVAVLVWLGCPDRLARLRQRRQDLLLAGGLVLALLLMGYAQGRSHCAYHYIPLQWGVAALGGLLLSLARWPVPRRLRAQQAVTFCLAVILLFGLGVRWQGGWGRFWFWTLQPTSGTVLASQLKDRLQTQDQVVLFDMYAQSFLSTAERRTPFPYIFGAYHFYLTFPPDHPGRAEIMNRLADSIRRPDVKLFVIEVTHPIDLGWKSPPSDQLVRTDPELARILAQQYEIDPVHSSDKFLVYWRKPAPAPMQKDKPA